MPHISLRPDVPTILLLYTFITATIYAAKLPASFASNPNAPPNRRRTIAGTDRHVRYVDKTISTSILSVE
jgi:hypothetical protein